jgi:hypothetical protein
VPAFAESVHDSRASRIDEQRIPVIFADVQQLGVGGCG